MLSPSLAVARKAHLEGKYTQAIAHFQGLLSTDPGNAKLYLELSSSLIAHLQYDEALVVAKQAQLYAGNDVSQICYLAQIGHIYLTQDRLELAAKIFEQILTQAPCELMGYLGLSHIFLKQGYPSKAEVLLKHVAANGKNDLRWVTNMSMALFMLRKTARAIELILNYCENQTQIAPSLLSNAFMFTAYLNDSSPYSKSLRHYWAMIYPPQQPTSYLQPSRPAKFKITKVGFVSADLCWHPVGYFLLSFLPYLKEHGIEIYLYANTDANDSLTSRLLHSAATISNIQALTTQQATDAIRGEDIDVLIDLSGHTAGNRLDIFNQRAAPLQISYLGYPESTYVGQMDFILTDEGHIRADEHQNYSEAIHYLPSSRFCFTPPISAPSILPAPYLLNGYVTFGSFANPSKMSAACVQDWGQLLQELPQTRLQLRHRAWADAGLQDALLTLWRKMGIAPGRIEFHGHSQYEQYLRTYSQIDFILDTHPFTGGTTTCEALWMGAPVLTREGNTPASRQSATILRALGEDRWIAQDNSDVVRLVKWAIQAPHILKEFKEEIRSKFARTSLGNGAEFAKNFCHALNAMWGIKSSCNGKK